MTAFRHQLSYLTYAPSTGAFADSTGATVTAPVTPTTSDVVQDLTAGEEWSNDNTYPGPSVQSAKLTLDGTTPKIAYRYRSADSGGHFRVYYAYPSGGDWVRKTVYAAWTDLGRPRHHLGRDGHQADLLRDRLGHRPGLRRDAVGGRSLDRAVRRAGRERGPARGAPGLGRPRCALSAGHRAQLPLLRVALRRKAERLP